jgi:hypothetical protein
MDAQGNSEARIGWGSGTKVAKPDGVMFELDEVTAVLLPEETVDDVEVTHMKSPRRSKEYKPGLGDSGDGSLELNYIPGSPTDLLLREMQTSRRIAPYETTLPDEAGEPAWLVSGFFYVKGRSRAVAVGDRMACTISVRFTGPSDEEAAPAAPGGGA